MSIKRPITGTLRVEVRQEDIARGVRDDACRCPIALAVSRLTTDVVYVEDQKIEIVGLGRFYMPEPAVRFVAHFDNGDAVEPFAFDLELDDQ